MNTNLLAVILITLSTNVVERFPQRWVATACPNATSAEGMMTLAACGYLENVPDPQEKWITTNIVETTVVRFILFGQSWETKKERTLTNWVTHLKLTQTWAEIPGVTIGELNIGTNMQRWKSTP